MSGNYVNTSGYGGKLWKAPVATLSALPQKGNNQGDLRVATDSGIVYQWQGSAWVVYG